MQAALLHEAAPYTPGHSRSTQNIMLISLLLGFGVGMVFLSPMHFERYFASQHPAMDMPVVPTSSLGASTHTAPVWLRGFANQKRQFVPAFKPMTAMANGAMANGAEHTRSRSQVVRASVKSDAVQQFQSALEFAEECIGECLREWNDVEARAAEVAYIESGQMSKEDVDDIMKKVTLKMTLEKIMAARMELQKEPGSVNVQMLKDTAKEMKDFSKMLSTSS